MMDTNGFVVFAGIGLFFFLMSIGSEIPVLIKEYLRQKHIEKIITQLPESERKDFIKRGMAEQAELQEKLPG